MPLACGPHPLRIPLEAMDCFRRSLGEGMDRLGQGPVETPSTVSLATAEFTLKRYQPPRTGTPTVLVVPAPIKRGYIWDLLPEISVVRQFLRRGMAVYLMQWERPGPAQQSLGLDEYADQLILLALQQIERETGQRRVTLAAHSLGGTLAAIFASLHSNQLQFLILLEAPLAFQPDPGAFGPLLAMNLRASEITRMLGNVPGSFLDWASWIASPKTFVLDPRIDEFFSSLDPLARRLHRAVVRWTLDESALPARLFEQVIERLYRGNEFMKNALKIAAQRASPENVRCPVLSVMDRRCRVIPPESILPFHRSRQGKSKVFDYSGDVGVALQHVGPLVGPEAHRTLWPKIFRWMNVNLGLCLE